MTKGRAGVWGIGLVLVFAFFISGCTEQTEPATNITATTATLNGTFTVGPNDKSGDYWFEWSSNGGANWTQGPQHKWGNQPCTTHGGAEGNPIPVHEDITGLTPNTTYIFRTAGTVCNSPTVYGDSNWQFNGDSDPPYEYDSFTTQLNVPKPTVTMPKPADSSARRFTLQAQSNSQLASASFEYRRADTDPWVTVPRADVSIGTGQQLAAWPVGLDSQGQTPQLTWDAWNSIRAEGTVQIRARFNDGSGGWVASDPVKVSLSRSNSDVNDATAPIGPGNVDLLTGNFSMTSTDASIPTPATQLNATRTYLSRGVSQTANGPLGPGWKLSLPVPTAASAYAGLNAGAVNGPRAAGTATDDPSSGGNVPWVNTQNAIGAPDGPSAQVNAHGQFSHYLDATNFGFSIPTNATIKGIKVEVGETQDGDGTVFSSGPGSDALTSIANGIRIIKGGMPSGDGRGRLEDWPHTASATPVYYGSKNDTWGLNWTPGDINANNFGLAVGVVGAQKTYGWAYVDDVRVTVYYAPAGSDGSVVLTQTDGTQEHFKRNDDGSYTPETGMPKSTLSESGDDYVLDDNQGDKTTFSSFTGDGNYVPTKVEQPGSANQTTFKWGVVNGTARVTQVLAPPPAGVDCSGAQLNPGCRALTFDYASSTTATSTASSGWGDYAGRLRQINLVAYDPASSTMKTVPVQQYSYDNTGHLRAAWDPRISPALKTTYAYDSNGVLSQVTPPGLATWNLAYTTTPDDSGLGRLKSVSRSAAGLPTETTTLAYGVPLSGSSAPYPMSPADVSGWGQRDDPTDATAIFPPNHVPANPPSSYSPASVYYMNAKGQQVNMATPPGRIETTEHDSNGQVIRELDPANRALALQSTDPPGRSQQLDTENTYSADGLQLRQTLGPLHNVNLDTGAIVQARQKTVITYDEGSPDGATFNLPTTKTEGAYVPSTGGFADQRTTTYGYDPEGWDVRQPTRVTRDPGGLGITTRYSYDARTGLQLSVTQPGWTGQTWQDSHITLIERYGSDTPWYEDLSSQRGLANQPSGNQPPVPTHTYTSYNMLDEPTVQTDTSGSSVRTTTNAYDAGGRQISSTVSSGPGTVLPPTSLAYDPGTGLLKTTTAGNLKIDRAYDAYGRPSRYTDSDGAVTTASYDSLDRPVSVVDPKGTRTSTYDPLTADLASLNVSGVGTFSGTYDADARLVSERLPDGIRATSSYDESGAQVGLAYDDCSSVCKSLLSLTDTNSIHDQTVSQVTTGLSQGQRTQAFIYDKAGRLTSAGDQYASTCKVHQYGYDLDSNRASLITVSAPKTSSGCGTYTTDSQGNHTYDGADRLSDAGVQYDAMSRTLTVPAADAGGSDFTGTYYANDLAHSVSQGGTTATFGLDPNMRTRLRSITGSPDEIQHYSDDGPSPSWTETPSNGNWTRLIPGISGLYEAVQKGNGSGVTSTQFTLPDLQGSLIGKVNASGTPQLQQSNQYDEFGVPQSGSGTDRYGWLGGHGVSTETSSGVVAMGARLYMPSLGRFLQMDPVPSGSANCMDYADQDPINGFDLDGSKPGKFSPSKHVHSGVPNWVKNAVKSVGKGAGAAAATVWQVTSHPGESASDAVSWVNNFFNSAGGHLTKCAVGAAFAFSKAKGPTWVKGVAAAAGCVAAW